ncbi:sulfotransferase [Thioclava sp. BHET1]|nr:sulfotransferase [Thioclava sp. BHET1]
MKTSIPLFCASEDVTQEKLSFVCFGSPRGGTSMVAGAMIGLGIDMGKELPVNVEDPIFNLDGKRNDRKKFLAEIRKEISRKGALNAVWGWKYPQAVEYLSEVRDELPNPRFVIVYRDPVPATIRAARGMEFGSRFDDVCYREMDKSIRLYRMNLELARKWQCPTLLVSYERASAMPEEFLRELSTFCGLALPDDIEHIVEFMRPGEYKNPNDLNRLA